VSRGLARALGGFPLALEWACGGERAAGLEVLEIARPGLRLLFDGEPAVPRVVFHAWMFAAGERLLRAYIGFGHLEDHEADWLAGGLAMVEGCAEPPDPGEPDRWKLPVLSHLASLGVFGRIRHRTVEMGVVYDWTAEALEWASKRHRLDRRCRIEPPHLCRAAVEIHRVVAEHRGADPEAAVAAEQRIQLESLVAAWREVL
jgi:hypothetical protein